MRNLLFIIFLSTTVFAFGQKRATYFQQFGFGGKDLGYKSSYANKILEDSRGFLWFATGAGLAKFDGYQFSYFTHKSNDSTSINKGEIRALAEDSRGYIWVGTRMGLSRLDVKTEKFKRYEHDPKDSLSLGFRDVAAIIESSDKEIWILTERSLQKYDPENDNFIRYDSNFGIEAPFYSHLYEDINGHIWIGTWLNGLIKVLKETQSCRSFFPNQDDLSNKENKYIRLLKRDRKNRIWVGTLGGLFQFFPETETFKKQVIIDSLASFHYRSMVEDELNNLWFAMGNKGLIRWNESENDAEFFTDISHNPFSLNSHRVYELHIDHFSNLWITTFNGLNKVRLNDDFELYQIENTIEHNRNFTSGLFKGNGESIWFNNTKREIFYIEKLGAKPEIMPVGKGENSFQSGIVSGGFLDLDNRLWFGMLGGELQYFDDETKKIHSVEIVEQFDKMSPAKFAQDPEDPDVFWFASNLGITKFNKETKALKAFAPMDYVSHPLLVNNVSRSLVMLDNGIIWAGVKNGLGKFDPKKDEFRFFHHDDKDPNSLIALGVGELIEFPREVVWMSSKNGLCRLDTKTETFTNFTNSNGLLENVVLAKVPDGDKHLWFTTPNYLMRINVLTNEIESFEVNNELSKYFRRPQGFRDDKGRIHIGSVNGFYVFHPDSLNKSEIVPKVYLTDFKIKNQSVDLGVAPTFVKKINLNYTDNVFSFEYAALHFTNPFKNQYQYILEGFQKEWTHVGNERKVTFTNLPSGQYFFKVKASNSDGIWNEKPLEIEVQIAPPYWLTSWFKALVFLVITTILYIIYNTRMRAIDLKNQKELAEQSARYKSRFLANISHEIRTPMNAIIGLSKLMLETPLSKKQNEYTDAIRQSSENLLVIINDLLDHSKIESGTFSFLKKPFDLSDNLKTLIKALSFRAEEKGLDLKLKIEKGVDNQLIGDNVRLNQILINLVGNAIKFTEKGTILLAVRKLNNTGKNTELEFEVSDTGVGIPNDKLKIIFERFKQASDETFAEFGGTGLGLAISRQLVERQGGKLEIESKVGLGTKLVFNLPFEINRTASLVKKEQIVVPEFNLENLKILVVEDTYFNQMLIIELLKKQIKGVVIEVAENGEKALQILEMELFDLILMDVKMPVMDGFEATQKIRKKEHLKHIPILGLTANALPEQVEKCRLAGMDAVVTKPINGAELFSEMRKVISQVD